MIYLEQSWMSAQAFHFGPRQCGERSIARRDYNGCVLSPRGAGGADFSVGAVGYAGVPAH
jgi:hypothetical protein